MTELLTAAKMRKIERAAIESGRATGLELMERAGRGVVEAVFETWPHLAQAPQSAVVLCGPGNNGGDGFVVARLLKEWGWDIQLFFFGKAEKLSPDARKNHDLWEAMGEIHHDLESRSDGQRSPLREAPLVLDALFGTGLSRPLGDLHTRIWQAFDLDKGEIPRLVSVDMPSGLCSDSGEVLGGDVTASLSEGRAPHALKAALTVSFHRAKLGHVLKHGPLICGRLAIKDIGLNTDRSDDPELVRRVSLPAPAALRKGGSEHKYSNGHALVLTGGAGKTGAARLAARGALRIGAGLVTLGVPGSAQMEVASQITAVMLTRVEDGPGLATVLQDDRINAVCLGPGLGLERARTLVPVALEEGRSVERPSRSVVLDADALSAFQEAPEDLFGMLHGKCVLTPHGGEFARLFPDLAERLKVTPEKGPAFSKVDATREAARRAGCIVLYKGADTVIAAPDGRCSVHAAVYDKAAPWLATAGTGDVLAGFITGLLARGLDPMQAAETAACLHVECARTFGPGLIAEDLPEMLPQVLRQR